MMKSWSSMTAKLAGLHPAQARDQSRHGESPVLTPELAIDTASGHSNSADFGESKIEHTANKGPAHSTSNATRSHKLKVPKDVLGDGFIEINSPYRLCEKCSTWVYASSLFNTQTLQELKNSASQTCPLCFICLGAISRLVPKLLPDDLIVTFNSHRGLPHFVELDGVKLEFFLPKDSPLSFGSFKTIPLPSGDTSSDASFSKLAQWLRTCTAKHKKCGPGSEAMLPSRVLDVSDSLETINLHVSQNELGRYVCLSHCWGDEKPACITTKASLESNKRGIMYASLPKTFRDAVDIVRRLQLRYLWIDSICIIQDDEGDWNQEAAKMASIYENSLLTIAAASSRSDSDGCYRDNPHDFTPIPFLLKGDDGSEISILARKRRQHFLLSGYDNLEVSELPLLHRGWVYQERFLSPRFVQFSSTEIVWDCNEGAACECEDFQRLVPSEFCQWSAKAEYSLCFTKYAGNRKSSIKVGQPYNVYERWRQVVKEYSGLAFTYESDKLPALLGLVTQMRSFRTGKYLYGMWEDTISHELAWYCKSPGRRPMRWRAPSWSWVSVEARVDFRIITNPNFTVINLGPSLSDARPESKLSVDDSHMVLEGYLIQAMLSRKGSEVDDSGLYRNMKRKWKYMITTSDNENFSSLNVYPDEETCGVDASLGDWEVSIRCLKMETMLWLILKSVRPEENVFERIGVLRVYEFRFGKGGERCKLKII